MTKIDKVKSLMAKKLTANEIAKNLGLSVNTVYGYMWKIRKGVVAKPKAKKLILTYTSNESIKDSSGGDMVNHPPHYKSGGIETIDFIEAKSLDYHLGNVVKYISRANLKGNKKEDLLKAQWYLSRAISNIK